MTVLTSAIVAHAKRRADMESGGVVNAAAEWLELVNHAYLDLWDLVAQHTQDHFVTMATFTLAGGAGAGSQYTVPVDLNEVRLVEYQTGDNTQFAPVPPFSLAERNESARSYRLMGSTLYVVPEVSSAGSYRIWYTPAPATLATSPSDVAIDARVERWWEYVGLGAAKRALSKEESNTSDVERDMKMIADRIAKMAPKRQGAPRVTRDVTDHSGLCWVNGRMQWLP